MPDLATQARCCSLSVAVVAMKQDDAPAVDRARIEQAIRDVRGRRPETRMVVFGETTLGRLRPSIDCHMLHSSCQSEL